MAKGKVKKLFEGTPEQGLTAQQVAFCDEYVQDLNGRRAAIAAGYTEKHADHAVSQLLNQDKNPLIAIRIRKLLELKRMRSPINGEELQAMLAALVKANPVELLGDDFLETGRSRKNVPGLLLTPEQFKDLPPEIGCMIEEWETQTTIKEAPDGSQSKTRKIWIKLVSKTTALGLLAKHLLGDKHLHAVQFSTTDGLTDRVDARKRVNDLIDAPLRIAPPVTNGQSTDGHADHDHASGDGHEGNGKPG